MKLFNYPFSVFLSTWAALAALVSASPSRLPRNGRQDKVISPRVMIISMFDPEAEVWHRRLPESGFGDLSAIRIVVPGLSATYPYVWCVESGFICQMTTSMGEINAAVSTMALALSNKFDLRNTYFLMNGIAGVNPRYATLGSVAIAKYGVQVALQYELDAREMPADWETGYFSFGSKKPHEYPTTIYGTEVFELNEALRDVAFEFAKGAVLKDSADTGEYRAKYRGMGEEYKAADTSPAVVKCDTATSDVYYSGRLLSESFEETLTVWTNGSGAYCMTAQEDNAVLGALVRAAVEGLVDFGRVIMMRSGSNFDRPPEGISAFDHLAVLNQNGFDLAIDNLYNAGIEIIRGILGSWGCKFKAGVQPQNKIGDIIDSLSSSG